MRCEWSSRLTPTSVSLSFPQWKTKPAVGVARQRRTIWSETEELEEAVHVHWCTSEVTCAPISPPVAASDRASGNSDIVVNLNEHSVMGPLEKPRQPRSLWTRLWKICVIVCVPMVLSPLLTTINTTVKIGKMGFHFIHPLLYKYSI